MKIKIRKAALPLIATGLITLVNTPIAKAEWKMTDVKEYEKKQEANDETLEKTRMKEQEANEGVNISEEKDNHGMHIVNTKVSTEYINIRQEPTTESEVIGNLEPGEEIQEISHQEGWYRIFHDGKLGYVSDEFITEKEEVKNDPRKMVYINSDTELLDIKTKEYKTTLPTLESAKVYDEDANYYYVNTDQGIGIISKENAEVLTGKYVIVDISDQVLNLYDESKSIFSTPVVTGNSEESPSDLGLFQIYWKERNCYLTGPGYSSYVDYWMPYNDGEGLHDAEYHTDYDEYGNIIKEHGWRTYEEFGGYTYQYAGSHGCVNLPNYAASEIYNNVEIGTKVLIKK